MIIKVISDSKNTMYNIKSLVESIKTDWKFPLLTIYEKHKDKIKLLEDELNKDTEGLIYPPKELIFNAFNYFDIKKLRVVIIGQDPYHGKDQAMGLSFSVNKGVPIPPSLRNIYTEIKTDYPNSVIPNHGDLSNWATQGILLLNATLTVQSGQPNSHQPFWDDTMITDDIIKYISDTGDDIIFVLWGNFAQKKRSLINEKYNKHKVIIGAHPSPFSYVRFKDCGHFKKINDHLKSKKKAEIKWM